jgi:hypothetical protein
LKKSLGLRFKGKVGKIGKEVAIIPCFTHTQVQIKEHLTLHTLHVHQTFDEFADCKAITSEHFFLFHQPCLHQQSTPAPRVVSSALLCPFAKAHLPHPLDVQL